MHPSPSLTHQTEAAALAARVNQYLSAGGAIQPLPGFTPKPLPARRHPCARPKQPAKPRLTEDQRLAARLRVFAGQRYTMRYTCMITGIAEREARRVAEKFNIRFRVV